MAIQITVDTEEEKEALLLASEHIHDANVDTDIAMVNYLAHLHMAPQVIKVLEYENFLDSLISEIVVEDIYQMAERKTLEECKLSFNEYLSKVAVENVTNVVYITHNSNKAEWEDTTYVGHYRWIDDPLYANVLLCVVVDRKIKESVHRLAYRIKRFPEITNNYPR